NYQRCVDNGYPITYEETLDLPGGRRTWLTTLTPVVQDNHIKYIVGAGTDITEQKAAQEIIRQSEERYRTLFENMIEGFALHEMIWDERGTPVDYRFLEVNPAFERLTGLRAEQVIGKTVRQLLPDLEATWIERYGEVARTGQSAVFEAYSTPLSRWYEVSAFSPKPGFFAAVFTDITQRKQWEAERERLIQDLQRKNSELSQFTYTVSHDLKSPLITILGFLTFVEQSLEQGNLDQAKADLQRIHFAAEKMQALLEGLLELSRIGRVINPPTQFPFGEVVMEAVQLLMGNIRHQGRIVEFEIAPNLPVVYGDRARLLQVMQNLLDNALKYMGEQSRPRIEIGWREVANELQFYVRDNGIGIEPVHQEKVFGLFEKLDPRAEGYGVGLALVKRIIEVHRGRVWVESEGEGKGCTFWFTLPKAP
ncbi:MAG: ATP-binding protein, partial [Anaerolineales bacterium]|nr:ATP-binding protein [Anaerolineales bacterium]